MYSPEADRRCSAGQGPVRPRRRAQPRRGGATRVRSTPICGVPHARPLPAIAGGFAFSHDGGDLTTAVHRCAGVGKCRADNSPAAAASCALVPGDQGREGLHPRARAGAAGAGERLAGAAGWDSPEVPSRSTCACPARPALGLPRRAWTWRPTSPRCCYRRYRGELRPSAHYALGWLPRWARARGAWLPRLANGAARVRAAAPARAAAGGMDTRRAVPRFATPSRSGAGSRDRAASRRGRARDGRGDAVGGQFSDSLRPDVAQATVAAAGGRRVHRAAAGRTACCGLTWISTGQLDGARAKLRGPSTCSRRWAERGVPIVGLEPSCTAVLRVGPARAAGRRPACRAGRARRRARWPSCSSAPGPTAGRPPVLAALKVVAQPHCHHHAVMGYGADLALLGARAPG